MDLNTYDPTSLFARRDSNVRDNFVKDAAKIIGNSNTLVLDLVLIAHN
jgi:hypothetical protein